MLRSAYPEVSLACGIGSLLPLHPDNSLVSRSMEPFTIDITVDTYSFYTSEETSMGEKITFLTCCCFSNKVCMCVFWERDWICSVEELSESQGTIGVFSLLYLSFIFM